MSSRECHVKIRTSKGEIVPQTPKKSFLRLARRQSHVVAVGEEGGHTADFVQPQLLSNTGESACTISIHAASSSETNNESTHQQRTVRWVWSLSPAPVSTSIVRE